MSTSESEPLLTPAVRHFLQRNLPAAPAQVERLTGDASTRTYFRLHLPDRSTQILALHQQAFDTASFPFLETTRLFQTVGVPVAAVLAEDAATGAILLQDLGDLLLQDVVSAATNVAGEVVSHYRRALDLIVRLQQTGTPKLDHSIHAGREALDGERFRLELDFFFQHLVQGHRQLTPTGDQIHQVEKSFQQLCDLLDQEPRVLCHRDYHSRNLMVQPDGTLAVVDHQDARLGPDTYDLVSLLWDPYVDLPVSLVEQLCDDYQTRSGHTGTPAVFRQRLDRMAVQRTLKAAGTFAAQKMLHGREAYLVYLPRVLRLARGSLERCPELQELQASLAPLVPELARS